MANEASLLKYSYYSLAFSQYYYIYRRPAKYFFFFLFGSVCLFIYLGSKVFESSFKTRTYSSTKVTFCLLLSGQDAHVICLSSSLKLLKLFSFLNRPNTNWGGTRYLLCTAEQRGAASQQLAFPPEGMAMSGQLAQLCLCCWAV